jgi:hypothetical protein
VQIGIRKLGKAGEILALLDCINDVTAAIAVAASFSVSGMSSDSAYRVDTTPRLAQWRIDTLTSTYRKSNPFRIGLWNWFVFSIYLCLFLDLKHKLAP